MKAATVTFSMFLAGCAAGPIRLAQPEEAKAVEVEIRHAEAKRDDDMNHGYMTYYDVGPGACGYNDSGKGNTDNIVAVSSALMSGQGAGKACDRKIAIKANGKEVTAVVRDKCPSCHADAIDVSEKVFRDLIGDLGVGKTEVSWAFI